MAESTEIGWTHIRRRDGAILPGASWNPIGGTKGHWICVRISPGCEYCYAETLNQRFGGPPYRVGADTPRLKEHHLADPVRWARKGPHGIFVCSMTDLFESRIPYEWIARLLRIMYATPSHIYLLLTKRPERMADMLWRWFFDRDGHLALAQNQMAREPYLPRHIWIGTTIESAAYTDRQRLLVQVPAAVHWLSMEPWLEHGPIDVPLDDIEWVVTGGESAGPEERRLVEPCDRPGARPGHEGCPWCHGTGWAMKGWATDGLLTIARRCEERGVAFYHKQNGGPRPTSGGRLLDGRPHDQFPDELGGGIVDPAA